MLRHFVYRLERHYMPSTRFIAWYSVTQAALSVPRLRIIQECLIVTEFRSWFGAGVFCTRPIAMHWANESPKQLMINVRTNVIRSWITGVIYSRTQRGAAHYILNFIITRTLVML
jgi:hypothetical protein